jgi:hypothetical protein
VERVCSRAHALNLPHLESSNVKNRPSDKPSCKVLLIPNRQFIMNLYILGHFGPFLLFSYFGKHLVILSWNLIQSTLYSVLSNVLCPKPQSQKCLNFYPAKFVNFCQKNCKRPRHNVCKIVGQGTS